VSPDAHILGSSPSVPGDFSIMSIEDDDDDEKNYVCFYLYIFDNHYYLRSVFEM